MKITDIFIRRPVLATVVSLVIFVLGLRSIGALPILQYPFIENAVITVTTSFPGADPAAIEAFITQPLEYSIAQSDGIDYLTSTSTQDTSNINAYLLLGYDTTDALAQITTKVSAVINQLPRNTQLPVTTVTIGQPIDSMYIGLYSDILPVNKVSDYVIRIVVPKFQTVQGVQTAETIGDRTYALRVWLDPIRLSATQITANDVFTALDNNSVITEAGRTDGGMLTANFLVDTDLHNVDQFRNLILKSQNGAIVRIKDVGEVSLGATDYDDRVSIDGKVGVYVGIQTAPTANLLEVLTNTRNIFPPMRQQFPKGIDGNIIYDASKYIDAAIKEVLVVLIEAFIIVSFVIFIFLGSLRSVIIPIVAIPLSLVGTFFMMFCLEYSINLLTLLALVLAIGLVVDDAIIVVENIHRQIQLGIPRKKAAIQGARELANPIIAMSIVLIAVYVPIGFMQGLTGALFTEFAFTVAGAVAISAIVALTLSPMMCSKLLKPMPANDNQNKLSWFAVFVERQFEKIRTFYEVLLHRSLNHLMVTCVFAVVILASIYFLYASSKSELAPQEDQGIIITRLTGQANSSLYQTELYSEQTFKKMMQFPETAHVFTLDGITETNTFLNNSIVGMVLKPWSERKKTANQLQDEVQEKLNNIAGVKVAAYQPSPVPGSGTGLPFQFVISSGDPFPRLNEVLQEVLNRAYATGIFAYLDPDLKIDKEQFQMHIDRDKAADLGLQMDDIADVLNAFLSEDFVNYFSLDGRSYQVIPQAKRARRVNYDQILNYWLNNGNGAPILFSTIASVESTVVPETLNHFQQFRSATISAVLNPHVTQGEALEAMEHIAREVLPQNYNMDFAGETRQYAQESNALLIAFFFALIIIYLTLSALYESFRDPLIMLISVPMSICGALIFISLGVGGATLNIYTEVGLVTLIGLISKHGILIVQFANDLQKQQGMTKRKAVEVAAGIRLRPILMTTAAMVVGVIPLIFATGAGAEGRFNIGLVVGSGISIGTLFTLFVVPAMYVLLAERKHK